MAHRRQNISDVERGLSLVLGSAMLYRGLKGGRWLNTALGVPVLIRGLSGYCVLYRAMDVDTSPRGRENKKGLLDPHPLDVHHAITVWRPVEEVFGFLRDLGNVPLFIPRVDRVQKFNEDHGRLVWAGPRARDVSVLVDIVDESPGKEIQWEATLRNTIVRGRLGFEPSPKDGGTELTASVVVTPSGGAIGTTAFLKMTKPFDKRVLSAMLGRAKQVMETGETATIAEQPRGASRRLFGVFDVDRKKRRNHESASVAR